jgi:DegV family protein with EDD domain
MREYQIFADSSCDLPQSLIEQYNIKLIPFYVSFDHEKYYKENVDISNEEFYRRLSEKGVYPSTSLPSVQDYLSEFRQTLKEGKDLICLCLTQKFSGSYRSALNARQILEEQFPDADIRIIDSIQATACEGLLLLQAAYMKEAGYNIEQVYDKLLDLRSTARIMFTLDSLEYLKKGRRIGKVAAMAGEKLDLKPLIQLKNTELIPYSNVRGRKKALDKVYEMVVEYFDETGEESSEYDFCIANTTTTDDALYLQEKVESYIGRRLAYPVFQIGVTIGTYIGPGAIGICFVKKYNCI